MTKAKKDKKPEVIQLNTAEKHGITSLLQRRETAVNELNQVTQQIEESQKSIITTRGYKNMDNWRLDTQTWVMTRNDEK